jgi:hypothetical protein
MFRMKTEADYERLRESDLDWPELRACEDRLRSNLYLALTACGIDDYYTIVGTPGLGAAEQGFWVQMVYERRVANRFALRLCPTLNWDKLEVWICTHLFSDIFGEGVENETWHAPVIPGPGESLVSLMSRALLTASDLATSMTGWMKADRFMRTA